MAETRPGSKKRRHEVTPAAGATPPSAVASPPADASHQAQDSALVWVPAVAVLLGAGVWLLVRAHGYTAWTDDDAFISFRYARNLATGNGLVYNVGERVEGYTNFLWTVLLASLRHLDTDLPRVASWLGRAFALATPALLFLGTTRLGVLQPPASLPVSARWFLAALAPLLLCLSEPWAAWAVGGLENVFSAFLVTAAYLSYLWVLEEQTVQAAMSATGSDASASAPAPTAAWPRGTLLHLCALSLALAVLNHPSNLLFAMPIAVDALLRSGGRQERRALLPPLLLFLALVGTWVLWRWVYYGDWLPNTFHAKVGFTRFVLARGLRFLLLALKALPVAAAAVAVLALLLARARRPFHPAWLFVGAVLLHALYVLAVGGEEFPALRMFVVELPLLVLVLQLLANRLCSFLAGRPAALQGVVVVLVVAVLTGAHAAFLHASPRVRVLDQPVRQYRTALSRAAAERLRALLPAETLFAHSGAGLLAYYTNFRWIDTLGLTDRTIARRKLDSMGKGAAGHEKGDGAYVWSRQPDYVMFPGYPISDAKPSTRGDLELFAIPEFRSTYRSVRLLFEFQGPHDDVPRQHYLFLWERLPSKPQP